MLPDIFGNQHFSTTSELFLENLPTIFYIALILAGIFWDPSRVVDKAMVFRNFKRSQEVIGTFGELC